MLIFRVTTPQGFTMWITGLVDAADILSPDQNLISASELLNLPSHGQHANVIYKTQDNYSLWQLE